MKVLCSIFVISKFPKNLVKLEEFALEEQNFPVFGLGKQNVLKKSTEICNY
jgi:hypothetical protein